MPKTITSGNSHLLTEDVISLREASKAIPCRPHFATIFRWHQRGVSGVKLETYKVGGRLITSKQAINRFLEATQG